MSKRGLSQLLVPGSQFSVLGDNNNFCEILMLSIEDCTFSMEFVIQKYNPAVSTVADMVLWTVAP